MNGIENLVILNRYALDVEASESAANLQTYGAELAKAKTARDSASAQEEVTRSAVSLKVRKANPLDYGLSKFTEDSIEAIVNTDQEVVDAVKALLKAKEDVYLLEAAVNALNDKSSRIKDLVSLWIGGYYAEPSDGKAKRQALGKKE